jgi:AbrB family looped-hinge helix DNA binding protein
MVIPVSNTPSMKTSRMTVKGQVTVPKAVRDDLGLRPGDPVGFVRDGDEVKIVRVEPRARGSEVVERLRRARWNPRLTTRRLMVLTRGGR